MTPQPSETHGVSPASPGVPGRKRSEQSREALLQAARDLSTSVDRYRDISIQAIAKRASSSKATIYRWWSSKAELIREACLCQPIEMPMGSTLHEDVTQAIHNQLEVMRSAASAPVFAGTWAELVENRKLAGKGGPLVDCPLSSQMHNILHAVFERARLRGEWHGPADLQAAYEALFGILFCRLVGQIRDFSDEEVQRLGHLVIEAARPRDLPASG